MALFIQSANVLVSRVAQWVGAIPFSTEINATAFNSTTGVITTSANPTSVISVGDFIGPSAINTFAVVIAVSSTTITVDDPDGMWGSWTLPTAILKLPTQSSIEIQSCIQFAELKMRTIELPALRTNPYGDAPTFLVTNSQGLAPIPADMNSPILFFPRDAKQFCAARFQRCINGSLDYLRPGWRSRNYSSQDD